MNCSIDELCFDETKTSQHLEPNIFITIGDVTYRIVLEKHDQTGKK
jgi:hypothetical protein